MRFNLEGKSFKERLFIARRIFEEKVVKDLLEGRIPVYHILHFEDSGVDNHYMTPISLEPVDKKGNKMIWLQDFEFFLYMFLTDKRVKMVEYDEKRPAVIFDFYGNLEYPEFPIEEGSDG